MSPFADANLPFAFLTLVSLSITLFYLYMCICNYIVLVLPALYVHRVEVYTRTAQHSTASHLQLHFVVNVRFLSCRQERKSLLPRPKKSVVFHCQLPSQGTVLLSAQKEQVDAVQVQVLKKRGEIRHLSDGKSPVTTCVVSRTSCSFICAHFSLN